MTTTNTTWQEKENALYKSYKFADFSATFAFMTRVALLAEKHDHHPRWTNTYNTLEIWLNTHDAGDTVTYKDRELAEAIDNINA
jgi:4a-hydroxytetrahydrobiopterin dehydratase